MRLLIVGHTAHYYRGNRLVGWGPMVREIDFLARAFDSVTHLATLHPGPAPESALPYRAANLHFAPLPPSGGVRLREKARVLQVGPYYLRELRTQLRTADVVHVRAPSGLALYAMLLLRFVHDRPRWIKYGGNWSVTAGQPLSFVFQRWWLKQGFSRGPVTVNGRWPAQPRHVFSFDNPSFSLPEIVAARQAGQEKQLAEPVRLVFAGRLEAGKGLPVALQVLTALREQCDARLDVLGDGPERGRYLALAGSSGLSQQVIFHGWVSPERVRSFLAQAHFAILPSESEGWPKILSEAMAYGAVPVAGQVSAIPQVLRETGAGIACPPYDVAGFTAGILEMVASPALWLQRSQAGLASAHRFTYERYLLALDEMFRLYYGASPLEPALVAELRTLLDQAGVHA